MYLYFPASAVQVAVADLTTLDAAPLGAGFVTIVLALMWLVSIVFMIQKRYESRN
jgi:hypothetical protein